MEKFKALKKFVFSLKNYKVREESIMERLLKNHFIQFLISGVLLLGVLFIIFTPTIGLFKKLSNFSVHIMMGYSCSLECFSFFMIKKDWSL